MILNQILKKLVIKIFFFIRMQLTSGILIKIMVFKSYDMQKATINFFSYFLTEKFKKKYFCQNLNFFLLARLKKILVETS